MSETRPIRLTAPAAPADQAEDTARADLYGLLATLFYRAPDAALLHHIAANSAHADDAASPLGQAWNALGEAAAGTTEAEAADEYQQLFVGIGKPDVFLYGSYYQTGFLHERPLVAVRDDLARYGLERHEGVSEPEDHIATLCEVMRFLIAGDDVAVSNLGEQQRFFARHLQPWVESLCDTVVAHPGARFYARAAQLLKSFAAVEAVAMEMH